MITFKHKLQRKTFLTTVSTPEGKGKDRLPITNVIREQKAESCDKEHSELFSTLVTLTARYLSETPSVQIRQVFDITTKTKCKMLLSK